MDLEAGVRKARVPPRRNGQLLEVWEGNCTGPTPVGVEQTTRLSVHAEGEELHQGERDGVELPIAPAVGDESSAFLAGIVDRFDLDIDADHPAGEREAALVLERLTERPELLVVPVGVDGHFVDQLIDLVAHRVGHYGPSRAA